MPSGSGDHDGEEGQGMEVPISEEPESIDFLLPQIPDEGLTLTQHSVRDCPHIPYFFPSTASPPIFKLIWRFCSSGT